MTTDQTIQQTEAEPRNKPPKRKGVRLRSVSLRDKVFGLGGAQQIVASDRVRLTLCEVAPGCPAVVADTVQRDGWKTDYLFLPNVLHAD